MKKKKIAVGLTRDQQEAFKKERVSIRSGEHGKGVVIKNPPLRRAGDRLDVLDEIVEDDETGRDTIAFYIVQDASYVELFIKEVAPRIAEEYAEFSGVSQDALRFDRLNRPFIHYRFHSEGSHLLILKSTKNLPDNYSICRVDLPEEKFAAFHRHLRQKYD
jgi:hypothetical protein